MSDQHSVEPSRGVHFLYVYVMWLVPFSWTNYPNRNTFFQKVKAEALLEQSCQKQGFDASSERKLKTYTESSHAAIVARGRVSLLSKVSSILI